MEKKRTFADIQKFMLEDKEWQLTPEDREQIVPEVGWTVMDL